MRTSMMLKSLLAVVLSLCWSELASGHVFRTGTCPEVDVVKDFNYEKFRGKWYVIEKSQTTSSCMQYNFTVRDDGSKSVMEKYRLFGLKIFNWNDFSQTGNLRVSSENEAKMTVQFPFSMNPFTPASFWVVATDYNNYAAIWSCRRFIFGHFQSAMILGRNTTLDRPIINKMRSRFEYFGVDRSDLSVIDQSDCTDSTTKDPVDEITDLLTNTTSLKPSVVATVVDQSEVMPGFATSTAGDVAGPTTTAGTTTTASTIAKEVATEREPEPLDSDNMP